MQTVITRSAWLACLAAVPGFIVLVLWGDKILAVRFGPEYASGYATLLVLGLAQVATAMFGTVGTLLNMAGKERYVARTMMIAALCNVIANFLLIPKFGIMGAAYATLFTMILWNIWLFYVAWREIGVISFIIPIKGVTKN